MSADKNPGQVYFVAQILYKVNIGLTKSASSAAKAAALWDFRRRYIVRMLPVSGSLLFPASLT